MTDFIDMAKQMRKMKREREAWQEFNDVFELQIGDSIENDRGLLLILIGKAQFYVLANPYGEKIINGLTIGKNGIKENKTIKPNVSDIIVPHFAMLEEMAIWARKGSLKVKKTASEEKNSKVIDLWKKTAKKI